MAKFDKRKKEPLGRVGRVERENRYNKIITISTITIVVAIILIVFGGAFWEGVIKSNQIIVTVNGKKFTTRQFQKYTRYERDRLLDSYESNFLFLKSLYSYLDENTIQTALQQLYYMQYQLDPAIAGQNAMKTMIQNVLIEEEAQKLGIEITDQELNEFIQSRYDYFPNGTPTPSLTPMIVPTSTFSQTQLALITLEPATTAVATATNALDPIQGSTAISVQESPIATITPFTYEDFKAKYSSETNEKLDSLKITEQEFIQFTKANLLRQKMFEIITKDIPDEQDQVWARHIIVEDEATANEVYDKLIAGEDFSELAVEYSIDGTAELGGDLGWFSYNDMVSDFSDAAFDLDIGVYSEPIKTDYGWHIIQVIGHEMRHLSASQYEQLRNQEFEAWLMEKMDQAEIEYLDDWVSRSPEKPEIPATMRLQ